MGSFNTYSSPSLKEVLSDWLEVRIYVGSRLEDIIVEGGQPNDDKKQTKGGRGVENGRNLVDVIYGCPLIQMEKPRRRKDVKKDKKNAI